MLALRERRYSPHVRAELAALGFAGRPLPILPTVLGITAILDVCATVAALLGA
jgi:hypothetical protein